MHQQSVTPISGLCDPPGCRCVEADLQTTLAMLAATEKVKDLPLWRSVVKDDELPPQLPAPMFN
jgi:hypothetical protein